MVAITTLAHPLNVFALTHFQILSVAEETGDIICYNYNLFFIAFVATPSLLPFSPKQKYTKQKQKSSKTVQ